MPVYTVHAPTIDGAVRPSTDRFVFVRDGFHVWAAVGGALWFAVHRLWLALLGYVILMLAIGASLWFLRVGSDARITVMFLIAVLTGFEAASLQRWTLSRGKWRQLDVVVAENLDVAERRFFDRWVGRVGDATPADRGSVPPVYPSSRPQQSHPNSQSHGSQLHGSQSHGDVMGLFPQPGVPR
jgi:hypothetical protein